MNRVTVCTESGRNSIVSLARGFSTALRKPAQNVAVLPGYLSWQAYLCVAEYGRLRVAAGKPTPLDHPSMLTPYELFVGLRYTPAKRRHHFISFISLTSMLRMTLGVAAPI